MKKESRWESIVAKSVSDGFDIKIPIYLKTPEKPSAGAKFVEDALTQVGQAMSRYMEPRNITSRLLDPKNLSSDEKIASMLSEIEDNFPKIDFQTDQGVVEATANMIGRVEVAKEQTNDQKNIKRLDDFKKRNTRGIAKWLSTVGVRKKALAQAGLITVFSLVLQACNQGVVVPPKTISDSQPDRLMVTSPALTEIQSSTQTGIQMPTKIPTPTFEVIAAPEKDVLNALEIEKKIFASKIPIIEYNGYSEAGVIEPEEIVVAQFNFLEMSGYKTITDKELANFISGDEKFPAKTVALRIDQRDGTHFEELEKIIRMLESRGFTATVYITSAGNFNDEQMTKLADWYQRGLISIGSHSVDHPNFTKLSYERSYKEAEYSKKTIEGMFLRYGVNMQVVSFAFPYDSVPENLNFLKQAGYKFALGGTTNPSNDNAKVGDYYIYSNYSYSTSKIMKAVLANPSPNFTSTPLIRGITFDRLMILASTPVTKETIKSITGKDSEPIYFGKFMEVPRDPDFGDILVRPLGIIVHTDDQGGNDWQSWNSETTYFGLIGQKTDVHLGVGLNGVTQYLPMYKEGFVTPTRGASGFASFINIELSGRDYNDVINPNAPPEKIQTIKNITTELIQLLKDIKKVYPWIDLDRDLLGHLEASASGKTDPGADYMNYLRSRITSEILNK